MTLNPINCRTILIADVPAIEDAFGPHERVAGTIAGLVESAGEGGKTIALEGGWGAGKSTVVMLLRKILESREDIRVSVFDAWAHQGDPLRRTFLETLIASLGPWLDRERWDNRKRELAGRLKVTETQETPRLTPLAKILGLAFMTVPVGIALVSLAGHYDADLKVTLSVLGGVLSAAPLVLVLLLLLALAVGRRWRWLSGRLNKLLAEGPDIFALVTGQTRQETVSQTYESRDPTSVEFERTFHELMDEALGDPGKRLVLVLDNLDRVTADDALAVWSSMQTFLQRTEHAKPSWLDKLWVLIPYDPSGIRRLWDRAQPPRVMEGDEQATSEGDEHTTTEAFLDKTFQLRFEVPPAVLSGWRAFLRQLLQEALPDHGEADLYPVYRVFSMCAVDRGRAPTPRELKLYVNGVAALHLQREHDFPLSHLAYYVLLRRGRVDVPGRLLDGNLPWAQVESFLVGSVRSSLAALYFNSSVNVAQELLLSGPIAGALSRADGEHLKQLAKDNTEGFWAAFEMSVAAGNLEWNEPASLASAATGLAASGLLENKRPEVPAILAALRRSALAITSWSPFSESTGAGIAALCRLVKPDEELVSRLFEGISSSKISTEEDGDGVAPAIWSQALLTVLRELRRLGHSEADSHTLTVPSDSDGWIGVCHSLVQGDATGEFWRLLKPPVSVLEVSSSLAGIVSQGNFSTEHADTVRVTITTESDGSWVDLASAIYERLEASNTISSPEVLSLFESLWLLRPVESTADGHISNLGTQGHALHHLHNVRSDDEAAAWCMFVFLRAAPGAPQPPAVGSSEHGFNELQHLLSSTPEGLVTKFADLLFRVDELPLLFTIADANPQSRPFAMSCLRMVGETPHASKLFFPGAVLKHWALIEETFELQLLDELVRRLLKETKLDSRAREIEFDPELAGLYSSLVRAGAAGRVRFRTWCVNGIRSADKTEWESQLTQEGPLIGLLLSLLDRNIAVQLDIAYQDALTDHGKMLMTGSCTVSAFEDRWNELLRPLDGDARAMLQRRLFDGALAADGAIAAAFFSVYGDEMSNPELLRQYRDAPYRLFTPLVTGRNEAGLRWLAGSIQASQQLFREGFDQATLEDFKHRIRQEISKKGEPSDEAGRLILKIARLLGVRRTPRK